MPRTSITTIASRKRPVNLTLSESLVTDLKSYTTNLSATAEELLTAYVVVVQSSLFDGYRRRVVVPLVRRSMLPAGIAGTRMNPSFKVRGAVLVLHPLDMVSVACDQLGECVGSLAEHGQEIADALDELLTRS